MKKLYSLGIILLVLLMATASAMATVSDSTSRIKYACSGTGTTFDFSFGVNATGDIQVIYTDAAGAETVLLETTHYEITATNNDYSSGGTVTTVAKYDYGTYITILRDVTIEQESDFTEGMPTLYETFEDGLDDLTRVAQQLHEQAVRTPSLAVSSAYATAKYTFPDPEAGKVIGWNAGGTDLTLYNPSSGDTIDIASSIEVIGDHGNNIATAVTDIGSVTETTLLIDVATPGDTTVGKNIQLWFTRGGSLTGTVAINGPIMAGLYAIFSSTATITFGSGYVNEMPSEWWGIVKGTNISAGNRTANAVAMQSCIDAATLVEVPCLLPSGGVEYSTTLLFREASDIRGAHARSRSVGGSHVQTKLYYTGTSHGMSSDPAIYAVKRIWRVHLEGFTIKNTNAANTGHGLNAHHVSSSTFRDLNFEVWGGYGVYSMTEPEVQGGTDNNIFDNVTVTMSSNGFYINGVLNTGSGSAPADSGNNAETAFINCKVQFVSNPDGTESTGVGWWYGRYSIRTNNLFPVFKQGPASGAIRAAHLFDTENSATVYGMSGEVNATGYDIELTSYAESIQIFGTWVNELTILDNSTTGHNVFLSTQLPMQLGRRPFNYEAITFYIEGPSGNVSSYTDLPMKGLGTETMTYARTSQYQPFVGSVIGVSAKRYGGTHTAGDIKFFPTKNGTEYDTTNFYVEIDAGTPVTPIKTEDKLQNKFVATNLIGCSYTTSASFNGTGLYVVDVWISRDGITP